MRALGATLASLWLAWALLLGCARPGHCFQRSACCGEARAAAPTTIAEEMPCCRVIAHAIAPRVLPTPTPPAPALLAALPAQLAPSWRTPALLPSAAPRSAPPLFRTKCALLL